MDLLEAIEQRHSVRSFTSKLIDKKALAELKSEVERCNEEGRLSIRLVTEEPEAFDSTLAHYGKFSNVRSYFIMAGKPDEGLEERTGYYGEKLVLLAQQLGLNTCWVALTFKKRYVKKMLAAGDKLVVVIALGYGTTQGSERKSKSRQDVASIAAGADVPDWFYAGVDAALLAPTAINQQSFEFGYTGETDSSGKPIVSLRSKGGTSANVDLGIVRLHFEIGAGTESFAWERPLA